MKYREVSSLGNNDEHDLKLNTNCNFAYAEMIHFSRLRYTFSVKNIYLQESKKRFLLFAIRI